MTALVVRNIDYLATFDDEAREIKDGALLLRNNVIEAVGTAVRSSRTASFDIWMWTGCWQATRL
jgi:cytosine/adenosine deaminase-related metal-dependent hydrolase